MVTAGVCGVGVFQSVFSLGTKGTKTFRTGQKLTICSKMLQKRIQKLQNSSKAPQSALKLFNTKIGPAKKKHSVIKSIGVIRWANSSAARGIRGAVSDCWYYPFGLDAYDIEYCKS